MIAQVEDTPKHWTSIGSELEPLLMAASVRKRGEVLEQASKQYDRSPQTLRRMVKAFRYVTSRAKATGLTIDKIKAPVVCVEVLERLEKNHPRLDLHFRHQVLTGRHKFEELLRIEKSMRSVQGSVTRDGIPDWRKFEASLVAEILPNETKSPIDPNSRIHSDIANQLLVDREFSLNGLRGAIFLSPKILFSESRGKTLSDVLPRVVTASLFYDTVMYIALDFDERRDIDQYFSGSYPHKKIEMEIIVLSMLNFTDNDVRAYSAP